ncbi:GNAT family N-acetyltransferase [Pseudomonas reactans]
MKKTVRVAVASDVGEIFDIRTSVNENHLSLEQLIHMGITHSAITKMIIASPCSWIAEVDGVAAGFAIADAEEGCVFAAFVRPEFEGRAIGRMLLAQAEDFLFQYHQKIWLVTAGVSRASGFYRTLGWVPMEGLPGGDIRFEKTQN